MPDAPPAACTSAPSPAAAAAPGADGSAAGCCDIDPQWYPGQPELEGGQEGSEVPSVLRKLQKWGDYESFGTPVWPTRFVPMKTPLSHGILRDWKLAEAPHHSLTVQDLLAAQQAAGRAVGLIIDLTNHDCLYEEDIPDHVRYQHIQLVAKELPSLENVRDVAAAANAFWAQHPDAYIAIHCAYGFNRTGFVVCSYLIEQCGFDPATALASFAASRPPGVKHEKFKTELQQRYQGLLLQRARCLMRWQQQQQQQPAPAQLPGAAVPAAAACAGSDGPDGAGPGQTQHAAQPREQPEPHQQQQGQAAGASRLVPQLSGCPLLQLCGCCGRQLFPQVPPFDMDDSSSSSSSDKGDGDGCAGQAQGQLPVADAMALDPAATPEGSAHGSSPRSVRRQLLLAPGPVGGPTAHPPDAAAAPRDFYHHLAQQQRQQHQHQPAPQHTRGISSGSGSFLGSSPDVYRAFRLNRFLGAADPADGRPTALGAPAASDGASGSCGARSESLLLQQQQQAGGSWLAHTPEASGIVERAGTVVSNSSFGCSMFDRTPSGMHVRAGSARSLGGWDEAEGASDGVSEEEASSQQPQPHQRRQHQHQHQQQRPQQQPAADDDSSYCLEDLSSSSPPLPPPLAADIAAAMQQLEAGLGLGLGMGLGGSAASLDDGGVHGRARSSSSVGGGTGRGGGGAMTRSSSGSSGGAALGGASPRGGGGGGGGGSWRGSGSGAAGAGAACVENESFGRLMGFELLKMSRHTRGSGSVAGSSPPSDATGALHPADAAQGSAPAPAAPDAWAAAAAPPAAAGAPPAAVEGCGPDGSPADAAAGDAAAAAGQPSARVAAGVCA